MASWMVAKTACGVSETYFLLGLDVSPGMGKDQGTGWKATMNT